MGLGVPSRLLVLTLLPVWVPSPLPDSTPLLAISEPNHFDVELSISVFCVVSIRRLFPAPPIPRVRWEMRPWQDGDLPHPTPPSASSLGCAGKRVLRGLGTVPLHLPSDRTPEPLQECGRES